MATIIMIRASGEGNIKIYKNSIYIGELGNFSNQTFTFVVGDTWKFEAIPYTYNIFEKYCTDAACSTGEITQPILEGIVVEDIDQHIYAYFKNIQPIKNIQPTLPLWTFLVGAGVGLGILYIMFRKS